MKNQIILTVIGFGLATLTGFAGDIDAKAIWDKQCKKCHAEDGSGNTTLGKKLEIKDYTKAESLADISDEDLAKMTKEGVEGTKMNGYGEKLSDDEIAALVAHMRAMAK
ncbi:MAG TPA: c-type cytochrome [Oceanipulchritudo sp.]|nr:c-type cytochrome [Oceanipulchritudo sp.]